MELGARIFYLRVTAISVWLDHLLNGSNCVLRHETDPDSGDNAKNWR
jgi:hypothetical protein